MSTISNQDIQRDPLSVLRRIEGGETLLVLRGEFPLAEVRPATIVTTEPRPFGLCTG
jgi:hypothetical protein